MLAERVAACRWNNSQMIMEVLMPRQIIRRFTG
jgi:hypothetical protein